MHVLITDTLHAEYEKIALRTGKGWPDEATVEALVSEGDWTRHGAETVVRLARTYGTAVLRNALALAAALEIEDGEAGL